MLWISISSVNSSNFEFFYYTVAGFEDRSLQEERHDKSIGKMDRVIENIIKLKEQFDKDELGFSKRLFVALKLEQNQLERKPIWATTWI